MYKVGVKIPMSVGHFLTGDFDEESVPHRHPYEVEWACTVEKLDENGFSVDISRMKSLLENVAAEISGLLLNDLPYFEKIQTSIENFASYVDYRLRSLDLAKEAGVYAGILESEIRVWEDPCAWASVISGR
jgi:6-pyruvoyl-tetrahydropterin synthase